jgi:hypothetical protein
MPGRFIPRRAKEALKVNHSVLLRENERWGPLMTEYWETEMSVTSIWLKFDANTNGSCKLGVLMLLFDLHDQS